MLAALFTFVALVASCASATQAIYPGNSTECESAPQWLDQPVDHNDTSIGTFKQKYYIATEFYTPGGPILLFQGEESTLTECLVRIS